MRVLIDNCLPVKLRDHIGDQGADFERAISGQPILAVLLPGSQGSRLEDVLPLVEGIEAALDRGQKGSIERV